MSPERARPALPECAVTEALRITSPRVASENALAAVLEGRVSPRRSSALDEHVTANRVTDVRRVPVGVGGRIDDGVIVLALIGRHVAAGAKVARFFLAIAHVASAADRVPTWLAVGTADLTRFGAARRQTDRRDDGWPPP
jgi:hypothetical protein